MSKEDTVTKPSSAAQRGRQEESREERGQGVGPGVRLDLGENLLSSCSFKELPGLTKAQGPAVHRWAWTQESE